MTELQNYLLPFLAVLVGYGIVIILKPQNSRNFKLLLSFSGAFLLALTVFTLLPEVFHFEENHLHDRKIGIFIIIGILLQIILEYFSKGAEHGHVHHHSHLQAFPWSLFFSLSIHSLLEGFPLQHHHTLVYGIFIHKLPIAIILTLFFINAKISKRKTLLFLILFSLMTPIGTFLSEEITLLEPFYELISAIVIGIFLHVSSVILFESSEGHKFNAYKLGAILVGFLTAYLL